MSDHVPSVMVFPNLFIFFVPRCFCRLSLCLLKNPIEKHVQKERKNNHKKNMRIACTDIHVLYFSSFRMYPHSLTFPMFPEVLLLCAIDLILLNVSSLV